MNHQFHRLSKKITNKDMICYFFEKSERTEEKVSGASVDLMVIP